MTPREPDRFDKQALEAEVHCPHLDMGACVSCIAAALRAAEASALERAAQEAEALSSNYDKGRAEIADSIAEAIRALIPPVAAPAAEPTQLPVRRRRELEATEVREQIERITAKPSAEDYEAPAAETGKAQGAEARIKELEWALEKATIQIGILLDRMRGCDDEIKQGRRDKDGHALSLFEGTAWIAEHRAKLAARVAPPEGEGT